MVFVDTSALYAVLDGDDANSSSAGAVWGELLDGTEVLLVTNYVLVECAALVQHRLGMKALRVLVDEIVPALRTTWITEEVHRASVTGLLAANRRNLSLVDSSSFEVMRRTGVRTAFAFDPHFAEQGFRVLPSE